MGDTMRDISSIECRFAENVLFNYLVLGVVRILLFQVPFSKHISQK